MSREIEKALWSAPVPHGPVPHGPVPHRAGNSPRRRLRSRLRPRLRRGLRLDLEDAFALRSLAYAVSGGTGYFLIGFWCLVLSRFDHTLASVWAPNACAVALLILARSPSTALVYAGLAIGSLAANIAVGASLSGTLIFTAANLAGIALVTRLIRREDGTLPDMHDLAQLGQFLFYGGIVGPLASSAIAALALLPTPHAGWAALNSWFLAESMGMILIIPPLLMLADAAHNRLFVPSGDLFERFAIMLGGYFAVYLVFAQNVYPLLFLVPPITLLVAFRLGGLGTALFLPGIVFTSCWMTYMGLGPITHSQTSEIGRLYVLQAFIAANFLSGLPIAAILAGRARMTLELDTGRRERALLTESITDAVLRIDRNGQCTYASPSVVDVLGRPVSAFVGEPIRPHIHDEAREEVVAMLHALLDGRSEKERITYRRQWDGPDGDAVFIEADCAAICDTVTGEREGIVVSARDVTERIKLETELQSARRRAEDAVRTKSEFLANMSHEIRTPMNGVLGFAELLIEGDIDEEHRRHAEMIVQSGRSMMLLLNDILDLSKIEAGQVSIDKAPVDPVATIEECLDLHRPTAEKKGVEVNFSPHPDGSENGGGNPGQHPWLVTDGLRLRQIMLNLVGNAVKFTEAGQIDISCHPQEDRFTVEIRDTGIGISPTRLETIFAPFTQEEADTARRFGGTGLGLTICRQLAGLLGGEIEATSEPGKGSTFRVSLPADYATDDPGPDPDHSAKPSEPGESVELQTGARILLVEDHDVNRILARQMLERCGQTVAIAHDGHEAIAMVFDAMMRERPFDLVLMDIQMPGCDGYSAARAIRAEGVSADALPIIALTANAYPDDIAAARKAGMQGHLPKPLVFADLARALQRWLPTRIVEAPEGDTVLCGSHEDRQASVKAIQATPGHRQFALTDGSCQPSTQHSPALMERWSNRRSEAIEAVRAALESGALGAVSDNAGTNERLARLVHKLAGTAAIFGEPDLGDQAAALERALRIGMPGNVREALAFELLSIADDPADTLTRTRV